MMNVLKHPSFFRPTSRPSSPAPLTAPPSRPDSGIGFERSARPLNKLSLSNFRRPSPAPSPAPGTITIPLVQDGSYLEMLGLKLSEAVSKALAQPTGPAPSNEQVSGRRPIPQGRGHALGALIASELKATRDNSHLQRAILRSLHRPLSVLLNNLSAHLLPIITSPAFLSPAAPTVQVPNPNPTQLHALAIAAFAGELLETFDDLGLGMDADIRGDGLKLIREGLVSLVSRVVNPLVAGIRNELMPLIEALEIPNSNLPTKGVPGVKPSPVHHTSIIALQAIMPVYARALARYTSSVVCQTTLATFLISLIWRALVALSHRPYAPSSPPSPGLLPVISKKRGSPTTTPPLTPPAGRFTIKLPPSRPSSPPNILVPATTAADASALYELFNLLPRPSATKEGTQLAREAVEDAFDGLKALPQLLHAVYAKPSVEPRAVGDAACELEVLTTDLPLLIALPALLHGRGVASSASAASVAAMLGLSEDEYRKGCLPGFGRAEECATAIAQRVYRVMMGAGPDSGSGLSSSAVVCRWLELEIADGGEAGV